MVAMEYVQSSNVEAIGYDSESQELHVKFLTGAAVYVYQGVPPTVHEKFMAAPSKGSFLHREVKAVYPYYTA